MNLAIIVGDFNSEVTHPMLECALERARALGADVRHTIHVFGIYDMPPIIKRLLRRADVDAVVLLGAVIKGETLHDEVIAHAVAGAASALAVEFEKPVGLGITGPGMSEEQAHARIGNAANAVEAVIGAAKALASLRK